MNHHLQTHGKGRKSARKHEEPDQEVVTKRQKKRRSCAGQPRSGWYTIQAAKARTTKDPRIGSKTPIPLAWLKSHQTAQTEE